jgi:acylphosphatase
LEIVTERERQRCEVYYAGRVQGVGFRYTVRSLAAGFQVTGFVRNVSDGRVLVVVEGDDDQIKLFLDAVETEMQHYIREVQQTRQKAGGQFPSFEIRH